MSLRLRRLTDADFDSCSFEWERDPVAIQLAAFTREDPSNREAFDAHYRKVLGANASRRQGGPYVSRTI